MPQYLPTRKPSHQNLKRRHGQAVIEYTMILVTMVLIFNAVFSNAKKAMYSVWICKVTPLIEVGCIECKDRSEDAPIDCGTL